MVADEVTELGVNVALAPVGRPVALSAAVQFPADPVKAIFTDVADRDAVLSAMRAELAGGPATGFDPVERDGRIHVSFTTVAVSATVTG